MNRYQEEIITYMNHQGLEKDHATSKTAEGLLMMLDDSSIPQNTRSLLRLCMEVDKYFERRGLPKGAHADIRKKIYAMICSNRPRAHRREAPGMNDEELLLLVEDIFEYYVGVPVEPPKDQNERDAIKRKILSIDLKTIRQLKLRRLLEYEELSHIEVLKVLYGSSYQMENLLEEKKTPKKHSRKTKEESYANLRNVLKPFLDLPEVASQARSEDFVRERNRLSALRYVDMNELGLLGYAVGKKRIHNGYIDGMIEAFPEYQFKRCEFDRVGKFLRSINIRSPDYQCDADEQRIVEAFMEKGERLPLTLYVDEKVKTMRLGVNINISAIEDLKGYVVEKLEALLLELGEHATRYKLEILLRGCVGNVFKTIHYRKYDNFILFVTKKKEKKDIYLQERRPYEQLLTKIDALPDTHVLKTWMTGKGEIDENTIRAQLLQLEFDRGDNEFIAEMFKQYAM